MTLHDLSKPQFDQALIAAECLCRGNVNRAEDCARFREESLKLGSMLGNDVAAGKIILEAVQWAARDFIGEVFADAMTENEQ